MWWIPLTFLIAAQAFFLGVGALVQNPWFIYTQDLLYKVHYRSVAAQSQVHFSRQAWMVGVDRHELLKMSCIPSSPIPNLSTTGFQTAVEVVFVGSKSKSSSNVNNKVRIMELLSKYLKTTYLVD